MYETVHCPDCRLPTRLVSVAPSLAPDIDDVTYHCAACDTEFMRCVDARTLDGLARPEPTERGASSLC
jgi:hypothetical protein